MRVCVCVVSGYVCFKQSYDSNLASFLPVNFNQRKFRVQNFRVTDFQQL